MAYVQHHNPFKKQQVKIAGESTSAIYSIGNKKYVDITEGSYKGSRFRIPNSAGESGKYLSGPLEFKRGKLRLVK